MVSGVPPLVRNGPRDGTIKYNVVEGKGGDTGRHVVLFMEVSADVTVRRAGARKRYNKWYYESKYGEIDEDGRFPAVTANAPWALDTEGNWNKRFYEMAQIAPKLQQFKKAIEGEGRGDALKTAAEIYDAYTSVGGPEIKGTAPHGGLIVKAVTGLGEAINLYNDYKIESSQADLIKGIRDIGYIPIKVRSSLVNNLGGENYIDTILFLPKSEIKPPLLPFTYKEFKSAADKNETISTGTRGFIQRHYNRPR